jgi:hypothetical protein
VRLLIALVIIIYLIGVGVELAPTIQSGWTRQPASELSASVLQELPGAFAWPAKVYRNYTAVHT